MSITPEQLRDLVFAGESAYKQAVEGNEAQAPAAQRALLQLQAYLSVRAAQSPAQQQQVAATLEQCTARLHTLRVRSGASEARYAPAPLCERAAHPQKRSLLPGKCGSPGRGPTSHASHAVFTSPTCTALHRRATLARTLAKASCPEGFRFTNPKVSSALHCGPGAGVGLQHATGWPLAAPRLAPAGSAPSALHRPLPALPQGFSLLEDLRSVEPFKQILQAAPSSQLAQVGARREGAACRRGRRRCCCMLAHWQGRGQRSCGGAAPLYPGCLA